MCCGPRRTTLWDKKKDHRRPYIGSSVVFPPCSSGFGWVFSHWRIFTVWSSQLPRSYPSTNSKWGPPITQLSPPFTHTHLFVFSVAKIQKIFETTKYFGNYFVPKFVSLKVFCLKCVKSRQSSSKIWRWQMRLIPLQTQNNSDESSAENNVENDNETIANIIYFF